MRRRWRHDGDVAGARVGAQALQHVASRQVGKVQVEHDDVGSVLVGSSIASLPCMAGGGRCPVGDGASLGPAQVDQVVLDQQQRPLVGVVRCRGTDGWRVDDGWLVVTHVPQGRLGDARVASAGTKTDGVGHGHRLNGTHRARPAG